MKNFFLRLFTPKRNRYLIWGVILSILGVMLIPFIIGIPIAGIGFTIFTIGVLISFAERFESGKKVIEKFEKVFFQIKTFVGDLFHSPKS